MPRTAWSIRAALACMYESELAVRQVYRCVLTQNCVDSSCIYVQGSYGSYPENFCDKCVWVSLSVPRRICGRVSALAATRKSMSIMNKTCNKHILLSSFKFSSMVEIRRVAMNTTRRQNSLVAHQGQRGYNIHVQGSLLHLFCNSPFPGLRLETGNMYLWLFTV